MCSFTIRLQPCLGRDSADIPVKNASQPALSCCDPQTRIPVPSSRPHPVILTLSLLSTTSSEFPPQLIFFCPPTKYHCAADLFLVIPALTLDSLWVLVSMGLIDPLEFSKAEDSQYLQLSAVQLSQSTGHSGTFKSELTVYFLWDSLRKLFYALISYKHSWDYSTLLYYVPSKM